MTIQLQSANYLKAQSLIAVICPCWNTVTLLLATLTVIIYTEEFFMAKIYHMLYIRGFKHNTSLILIKWF